jgi:hypothetical protein
MGPIREQLNPNHILHMLLFNDSIRFMFPYKPRLLIFLFFWEFPSLTVYAFVRLSGQYISSGVQIKICCGGVKNLVHTSHFYATDQLNKECNYLATWKVTSMCHGIKPDKIKWTGCCLLEYGVHFWSTVKYETMCVSTATADQSF